MALVIVVAMVTILIPDVSSVCIFPKYIQSPRENGVLLPWKTKTVWLNIRDDGKWREQSDVYVEGSKIWRYREEYELPCQSKTRRVSESDFTTTKCATRRSYFNRTCLQNDARNTFRVMEIQAGSTQYMCMMFLKRSNSVIQVMQGPVWDRNVPELCDDRKMNMEEWPWIASWNEMPSACPISGGFTFRTKSRLTNQDLCEGDWRMSRLEMECISGDGMTFIAPKDSKCNPFSSDEDSTQLYCWAGWNYGKFTYMIGSINGKEPQFCIRFPRRMDGIFVVFIYFSVICPHDDDGLPPSGINYYELRVQRKDPTVCEDENPEECAKLKEKGMCERPKDAYVQHCPKTCGQCDLDRESLLTQSCKFHPVVHGKWAYIDVQRKADMSINDSTISISDFGSFRCLSQFPNGQLYKTVSTFQNGCAKRYTCMEVDRKNKNVLQFRVGKSLREEHSYEDMCEFHDDTLPLLDKYRSSSHKNLIYSGPLWYLFCGFQGTVRFNGTFEDQHCVGTVSDTNTNTCRTEGILTIRGENCNALRQPRQFQCLVYITKEGIFDDFLITRSMDGRNHFNCWVISTYPEMAFTWPQRVMYEMSTPQCKMFSEVMIHRQHVAKSELFITGDEKSQCIPKTTPRPEIRRNGTTTSTSKFVYLTMTNPSRDNHRDLGKSNQAYSEHTGNNCKSKTCTFYFALFCYFLGRLFVLIFTENADNER